jgi:hypothetical protein
MCRCKQYGKITKYSLRACVCAFYGDDFARACINIFVCTRFFLGGKKGKKDTNVHHAHVYFLTLSYISILLGYKNEVKRFKTKGIPKNKCYTSFWERKNVFGSLVEGQQEGDK